jgi:hypothetical protein
LGDSKDHDYKNEWTRFISNTELKEEWKNQLNTKENQLWCNNLMISTDLRGQEKEIAIFRNRVNEDWDDVETGVPEILADSNYLRC